MAPMIGPLAPDSFIGALQQTLEGHADGVRSVAFSHNDLTLAPGSFDLTVRLWDPVTGSFAANTGIQENSHRSGVFRGRLISQY